MERMNRLRNRHFLFWDVLTLPLAVYASYVLRLEDLTPVSRWIPGMIFLSVAVVVVTVALFRRVGVYSRFWRYASVDELILLTGAWTISLLIASGITLSWSLFLSPETVVPRSIPLILLLLGLTTVAGPRLLTRILARRAGRRARRAIENKGQSHNVLIMGAGDAGDMIVRELQSNPQLGLHPIGFLDDDPVKHRVVMHGLPVLGGRADIPGLVVTHKVQQVIIAMPTAPGKEIRSVVGICEKAGVETKIVPGVYELLDGKASVSQVRNIEIEDLLRRVPVQSDIGAVRQLIAGKRVLVTGGGGSIGSELARQVFQCGPEELYLVGHGENSIFDIYHELNRELNRMPYRPPADNQDEQGKDIAWVAPAVHAIITDIRFPERVHALMEAVRPEIVFHAAAHKHVPLMELNPCEAILNNVIGTRTLVQAARAAGVERLVMISTDKAVNPTSVMGASKRAAELVVHETAVQYGLPYVAVRFGNVLGSRGSVIQTFRGQIARGGPVTVTHPEMKRYFMTIPEAVQLVLQASVLGSGGEVFVLDMGEPVRIVDLATDLIRLSGLELGRDIDIEFVGVRPGEKLFEEMFIAGEEYKRTRHEQIFIAGNASRFVPNGLDDAIDALYGAAMANDEAAILARLCALIPEFEPVGTSR